MKWLIEMLLVYLLGFGLLAGAIAVDLAFMPREVEILGVRIFTGDAVDQGLAKWVKGAPEGKYSVGTCPEG